MIGGYTSSENRSSGVSSLLLGVYEQGDLIFAGRAGTGFSQKQRKELENKLSSMLRKTSPFKKPPEERNEEEVFWLTPELIAMIKFQEWTDEDLLRQASFKGLREDKNPKEIVREGGNSVNASGKSTERMMPYVSRRVLSFLRCPDGIKKECFYQKHLEQTGKGLEKIGISENNGDKEDYAYIENEQGLLSSVQMGTLEFHVWGSKIDELKIRICWYLILILLKGWRS